MTLEEAMVKVWREALVEGAPEVELDGKKFAVRATPRKLLREVDLEFKGQGLRGLEQNPETESRWAQLAKKGAERDAVSFRRKIRVQRGGWQGDVVWRKEEGEAMMGLPNAGVGEAGPVDRMLGEGQSYEIAIR
jgi:hypothetical protein